MPQYVRAGTALLSGEEGDDDGKGTRVIDKVNVSFAEAVSGGTVTSRENQPEAA